MATYLLVGVRIGLGFVAEDLATARGRITDMQPHAPGGQIGFATGDATALPLADETVDVVIASEILEHIPNYLTVLEEALRVLKPGGRLCQRSMAVLSDLLATQRAVPHDAGWAYTDFQCDASASGDSATGSNLWAMAVHMHCMSLIGG